MSREDLLWFAIRVRNRCENVVSTSLVQKGFDVFLPTYKAKHRWSDRYKELDLPLFPGYLFCRIDLNNRLPILTTPGFVRIVGAGRAPLPVADEEISAVQSVVESGIACQPWPFVTAGQLVRVEEGPLAGLVGFVTEVKKRNRLVISVALLQRSVAVEIDRDSVRVIESKTIAVNSFSAPQYPVSLSSRYRA